jgi:hypothetical protein
VSRPPDGGRGFDGVFERAEDYWNPFEELMVRQAHHDENARTKAVGE